MNSDIFRKLFESKLVSLPKFYLVIYSSHHIKPSKYFKIFLNEHFLFLTIQYLKKLNVAFLYN